MMANLIVALVMAFGFVDARAQQPKFSGISVNLESVTSKRTLSFPSAYHQLEQVGAGLIGSTSRGTMALAVGKGIIRIPLIVLAGLWDVAAAPFRSYTVISGKINGRIELVGEEKGHVISGIREEDREHIDRNWKASGVLADTNGQFVMPIEITIGSRREKRLQLVNERDWHGFIFTVKDKEVYCQQEVGFQSNRTQLLQNARVWPK